MKIAKFLRTPILQIISERVLWKFKDEQKQASRIVCKKGVLRNFTKFTGKHLCQGLFFNKVEGLSPATLLKKRLAQVFSFEFCEISEKPFFIEHLWWLLLDEGSQEFLKQHSRKGCWQFQRNGCKNNKNLVYIQLSLKFEEVRFLNSRLKFIIH